MEKIILGGKETFIVAEHHQVLPIWQSFYEQNGIAPAVVTLDHHTDTLPSFSRISTQNSNFKIPSNLKIDEILKFLQHDEHIDYALKSGMVKSSVIIAHTQSEIVADERITLLSDGFLSDEIPLNDPKLITYFDSALEDEFLKQFELFFPQKPYILDIDLDYFKTFRSLEPKNFSIFRRLAENAEIITLSREEIWIKLLTFEDSNFNSNYVIKGLQKLLN